MTFFKYNHKEESIRKILKILNIFITCHKDLKITYARFLSKQEVVYNNI